MTPLAIVWNLADSWLHFHQLEICPPGNTKSIINRIGLCLVMKTMILTMVYLSWWAGSVQWRLQSLYDEVKIRRHVDKIYYLCLLKLFYFFSRKVYFSQIWLAIFLGKIFLYFINILPPCDTTCNCWKFGHQVAPLAFQIRPPVRATWISWIFVHQVASFVLVMILSTRWHHFH